jgi:hypothetical protein
MKLTISSLCLVFVLSLSFQSQAANRFWVSAAPSNWNNTANWSNVSGGAGGFSVPVAGDAVTFNNVRRGNCTIDVALNILSLTINAGYTGTITQGAHTINISNAATLSAGQFLGGSSNINIGGSFTLSGTNFTSTSAILEIDGDPAFTSGVFTHNNGTVKLNATGTTNITGTSPTFYILEFVGNGFNYNINSTGNVTVTNSLNISGALTYILNTGDIDVTGNINVTNTATGDGGSASVNIIGAGNQNFTGASAAGLGALPMLTINKPSGTLNLINFPASSNTFSYIAGTINAGSSTYCFVEGTTGNYTISGSVSLNNIEFLANTNRTFTVSAATTLTALGDFTMAGTRRITINTGNININGNIFLKNTFATGGGTATLHVLGAANQAMDGTAIAISQNRLPFVVINKSGGTLTLKGNISESRDWTYSSGTIDASSFASTVVFGGNNLNVTSAGMNFYNVISTGNTVTLANNLTVQHDLKITGGRIAPNANTINLAGNWNDYGTAGFTEATSIVNFNGTALQTLISPGGEDFTNLVVNNSGAGIQLNNDVTIATNFTMTQSNVNLNGNNLTLGLSVANNGTLVRTSGTITGTGSFKRWIKPAVISNGSVLGLFPMGTATDYRPFYISAPVTAPTTGGSITVAYVDATTNTSVPTYMDGATMIQVRKDLHWTVTTGNGLAGGNYNLDAQGTGFGLIGTVSDLRLTLVNSGIGTAGVNGGTILNPQINRTGLTAGNLSNSFYVASINSVSSPLPITLISFTAVIKNDEVRLSWSTSAEMNNDFFTIQKSKDETGWVDVLQVPGQGTGSTTQVYSASDPQPYTGISYYRLKQTDIDGKESYSPVVSIKNSKEISGIFVYPNPVSNRLFIQFPSSGNYQIAIEGTSGQNVFNTAALSSDNFSIDVSQYRPGIYFIQILHEGHSETRKIMIYK